MGIHEGKKFWNLQKEIRESCNNQTTSKLLFLFFIWEQKNKEKVK